MVVPRCIIALGRIEHLQAVLPAGVHREKIFAVFLRVIGAELHLRGKGHSGGDECAGNTVEAQRVAGKSDRGRIGV